MSKVVVGNKTVEATSQWRGCAFCLTIMVVGVLIAWNSNHVALKISFSVIASLAFLFFVLSFVFVFTERLAYCKHCNEVFNGDMNECPMCHESVSFITIDNDVVKRINKEHQDRLEQDKKERAEKARIEKQKAELIHMIDKALEEKESDR